MKTLVIIRGLPGCGKSTYADNYFGKEENSVAFLSTDDFWGTAYDFDPHRLGEAHAWNQVRAIQAMHSGAERIVIDNTNSQKWEYGVYVAAGVAMGYVISIVDLFDGGCSDEELAERCTHSVPADVIRAMRKRYER